jgi:hypothetical protein
MPTIDLNIGLQEMNMAALYLVIRVYVLAGVQPGLM